MYKKPKGLLRDVQQKRLTKKSPFLKKLEARQAADEWPKMTIEQLKLLQKQKQFSWRPILDTRTLHINCRSTVRPVKS